MTEKLPRKFTFRTVAWIALPTAAVSFALGYLSKIAVDKTIPGADDTRPDDTPIIVRDGSIVITSVGVDLEGFSRPDPNLRIHPKAKGKLGQLKVNGYLNGTPCKDTSECRVELVWFTGNPGQPGCQEYTVEVRSDSVDGEAARIFSSVPFSEYKASQTEYSDRAKVEYTYTWSPAPPLELTFREAKLHKKPLKGGSSEPAPEVLCSNPGCSIEFEYK